MYAALADTLPELLFLCHRIPYPPNKGDKIRAWHILSYLAQSYRVHLGCLADDLADLAHLTLLNTVCESVACVSIDPTHQRLKAISRIRPGRALTFDYFHDGALQSWVDDTLQTRRISRVFVFSSAMGPYVMGRVPHTVPAVLDMVDVDSEKWLSYAAQANVPMRWIWRREGRTLHNFEREAALWFDRTIFVSEAECNRFLALAPDMDARVGWVENGVDLAYFSPEHGGQNPYSRHTEPIVFTGTMDYRPNIDAVTFFARDVMPLIRAGCPSATFHIVGANPAPSVVALAALPGVQVVGRVDDVRPFLAHATLAVAPLQIARGIQNKVLEAMAMARPVVISPQALEGLRAQPSRDVLLAEDASTMAEQALDVLRGKYKCLGRSARKAVERDYAWETTLRRLDPFLSSP